VTLLCYVDLRDEIDDILMKSFDIKSYNIEDKEYKSKVDYETEKRNSNDNLKKHGTVYHGFYDITTAGVPTERPTAVSLPMSDGGTICICNDMSEITNKFGEYPNSCDEYGNVFFGIGELNGITPSIFHIANIMSICCISYGRDLYDDVVKCLRYLAICQASESIMIANDKYDRYGCFYHWKQGRLIPMSYDDNKTHTSLFSDERVNFFKLPESLWWALMMSMLGIFDEQLVNYSKALEAYGIEPNERSLVSYIRTRKSRNHSSYTFSSWDEEIWFLDIYTSHDDLESYVNEKFPEYNFKHVDVDLAMDWNDTSKLYIMRGPNIKQQLIYNHLNMLKDINMCNILSQRKTVKNERYGLFDVYIIRPVEDMLDEKNIYYERLGGIPQGCLSCGGENDLIVIVVSSFDEMIDIKKCIKTIDKQNNLIYEHVID
jgi:hypothetical protein